MPIVVTLVFILIIPILKFGNRDSGLQKACGEEKMSPDVVAYRTIRT